jgi:hypothetical protein
VTDVTASRHDSDWQRKLNQLVDALGLASGAANDPGLSHDLGAGTQEDSIAALIRTLPVTKVLV